MTTTPDDPLLVTVDDLGTVADADEALSACEMASGLVLDYIGRPVLADEYQHVLPVQADIVDRDPDTPTGTVGVVRLTAWPVTDVTSVIVGGEELAANQWAWDESRGQLLIDDPNAWDATVTYAAGLDAIPAGLRAVARRVALAILSNPAGVRSEQIGDYSVAYGGGVDLTALERRILDRYRPSAGTIRPA